MRSSDWSSDVCSSDLDDRPRLAKGVPRGAILLPRLGDPDGGAGRDATVRHGNEPVRRRSADRGAAGIGASDRLAFHRDDLAPLPIDRKSVVWGKSVSVRLDLGVRMIIKKKRNHKRHSKSKIKNK